MKRFLILSLALSALIFAQDDKTCRSGLFTRAEALSLARVSITAESRAYFYDDVDLCPDDDIPSCKKTSYLVNGDKVIVSKEYDDFDCVWFVGAKSNTVGWIESYLLEPIQTKPPRYEDWLGHWQFAENEIYLSKSHFSNDIIVEAMAFWFGMNNIVHVGEVFQRTQAPEFHSLVVMDSYDCILQLTLLDDYTLAALDNMQCGGANVSFDGIYKKLDK